MCVEVCLIRPISEAEIPAVWMSDTLSDKVDWQAVANELEVQLTATEQVNQRLEQQLRKQKVTIACLREQLSDRARDEQDEFETADEHQSSSQSSSCAFVDPWSAASSSSECARYEDGGACRQGNDTDSAVSIEDEEEQQVMQFFQTLDVSSEEYVPAAH